MNLLLIDTRINDVDKITDSLLENVNYVTFSYEKDTYDSLKSKILELGEFYYESIGIAQINYGAPVFDFLQAENTEGLIPNVLKNVALEDASLSTWTLFAEFCGWLVAEKQCKTVDLLACNIWSDPDWVYVINSLRERGIYIRASVDITGEGGNFILESDGVDMIGLYFTEAVLSYKYSFDFKPYWNTVFYNSVNLNLYNGTYLYSVYSELYNDINGNAYNGFDIKTDIFNINAYSIISDNTGKQTNVFLKKDGTIITSGSYLYGGNASRDLTLSALLTNINKIIPCGIGFLTVHSNGNAIFINGQDTSTPNASGIQINGYNIIDGIGNQGAICAITNQNSGIFITNTTTVDLQSIVGTGIIKYKAGLDYFCFIKSDNTAIIYTNSGINTEIAGISAKDIYPTYSSTNVLFLLNNNTIINLSKTVLHTLNSNVNIKKYVPFYSNNYCFLYSDGSGATNIGGTISQYTGLNDFAANSLAYAYLKDGNITVGGTTGNFILPATQTVTDNMVVKIYATSNAGFVALKQDKSVVFWGTDFTTMSGVTPTLHPHMTKNIEDVICGYNSFIFKRKNDIVISTNKLLPYGGFSTATASTFIITNDLISSNRNGTYNISASSTTGTNYAYNVMNTGSAFWQSGALTYIAGGKTGGTYNKIAYTTIQNIGSISGEWLQIKLPYNIVLTNYTIMYASACPSQVYLVGSTNGTTWYKIDYTQYEYNTSARITLSFTIKNTIFYDYYRFIFVEMPYSIPIYVRQSVVTVYQVLLFSSFNANGGYNILKSYDTPNNTYNDITTYNYPLILNYSKYELLTPSNIQLNAPIDISYTSNNIPYYAEPYHIYGLYADSILLSTYSTNVFTSIYKFYNVLLTTYTSAISIFDITNYVYSNGVMYNLFDLSINILSVPEPPIINNIVVSNSSIIVYFTQPNNYGALVYPITGYKYKLNKESLLDCIGTTSPITISNLTNGNSYNLELYSSNQIGISFGNNVNYVKNGYFDKARNAIPYILTPNDTLYNWSFNTDAILSGSSTAQKINYDASSPLSSKNGLIISVSHTGGGYTETVIMQNIYFTNLNKKILTFYLKFNGLTGGYSSYLFSSLYNNTILSEVSDITPYSYTPYSIIFTPTTLNGHLKFYYGAYRPGPFGSSQITYIQISGISLTDYIDTNINKNLVPYTNPSAPRINYITPENLKLTLNITQDDTGGFPITKYSYTLNGGVSYIDFPQLSPLEITGLANGTIYNVGIKATNAKLDSSISTIVQGIPYTNPDSPVITGIIPGNSQLTVNITQGANSGGFLLQKYSYSIDGGLSFTDISVLTQLVITGLTNGQTYQVIVKANNGKLDSANSNQVAEIPFTNPDAPTITGIIPGNQQLTVNITQGSTGGFPIQKYSYTIDNGTTFHDFASLSPLVITGLINGQTYQVLIKGNNGKLDSANSNQVAETPFTNPDPPTITGIIPGNKQLTIYITQGSTGGLPIEKYAYSLDGGITFVDFAVLSPLIIPGLANGQLYTVFIKANNGVLDSLASNQITEKSVDNPSPPLITNIVSGNNQVFVHFIAPTYLGFGQIREYKYSIDRGATFATAVGISSPITISGLTNQTDYPICLRSNNYLDSSNSNVVVGTPYIPPNPPTISTAVAEPSQITVYFTPGAPNGGLPTTSYFYSIDNGVSYTRLPDLNTTFTLTGLINGQTYEVILIANNFPQAVSTLFEKPGNNSIESNAYSATPVNIPDPPTIQYIESRENGVLYIHFSLGNNNGLPIYKLQYSTNNWKTYQTVNSAQSPFIVSNLQIGISYPFQIKAYNNLGLSLASNTIYGIPLSSITKNTTLNTKRAMPPKDQTTDGSAEFSQYRRLYEKTVDNLRNGDPTKKWTSEQPVASTLTFNRKIIAIGEGSINKEGEAIAFVDESEITPEEALRRLRRKK